MPTPQLAESGPFTATELEQRLRAPGGARLRAELIARLNELSHHNEKEMNSGLPTPEFARAVAICKALAAARTILSLFPVGR